MNKKENKIFTEFVKSWKELPPLVRASIAISIAHNAHDAAQRMNSMAHDEMKMFANRRSEVSVRFMLAQKTIENLFVKLANEADSEALKSGIDQDLESKNSDAD